MKTDRIRRYMSSQWEDEDAKATADRTSFEDAGESLQKEDEDERMSGMGDFDKNPSVSTRGCGIEQDRYPKIVNPLSSSTVNFHAFH